MYFNKSRLIKECLLATCALAVGITQISAQTNTSLTTLHSFGSRQDEYGTFLDGSSPQAALVQGSDGSFYGTTSGGGSNDFGTVFQVTTNGVFRTLYSFGAVLGSGFYGADGVYPEAPLVLGKDGGLYGTTSEGGKSTSGTFGALGYGTIFRITTNGTLNILYTFGKMQDANGNAVDGGSPVAGLVQGTDGSLYGTASQGGPNGLVISNMYGTFPSTGFGTVFKVTTNGIFTRLHAFGAVEDSDGNALDGSSPNAGLVQAADGNFYGTTADGGTNAEGTIFRITPGGMFTSLYSFGTLKDGIGRRIDGSAPEAALVKGDDGALYGTTSSGGENGEGTIFKITTDGTFTLLYSFGSLRSSSYYSLDGAAPLAALILGTDGNFYGTTSAGGTNNNGTIFQITAGAKFTSLYSFARIQDANAIALDGSDPEAGLVQGSDGTFFGTTYSGGGSNDVGTVFALSSGSSTQGQPPAITTQPQSLSLYPGAEGDFTVQAFGTAPLSFHWRKGNSYLSDGGKISGARTPTLTLTNVSFADQGNYSLEISNPFGTTNSDAASLTVTNVPDLRVADIVTPAAASTDVPFDISWTDTNAGTVTATGPWFDELWLSTNSQPNPDVDLLLADVSFNGNLGPGQSAARNQSVTLSSDEVASGQYHIFVIVDADNNFSVTNSYGTSSNVYVHVVLPPQIAVTGVTAPTGAWTKRAFQVDWKDTNTGGLTASESWVDQVWLSADNQLQPDVDKLLGEFSFDGGLDAGQSTLRQQVLEISPLDATNGPYHILVLADANHDVSDADNLGISPVVTVRQTPLAKLAVTGVTAPTSGLGGQLVQVTWTVCNQGQADSDVPLWYDHLYLSTTTNLTGVVQDFGTNVNPSYLAVGDCYQQNVSVRLPVGVSGSFYFVVSADEAGAVGADAPTNTLGATAVPINVQLVTPGFLHVVSVHASPAAPTTVWAGNVINVSWVVQNAGQSVITTPYGYWWDDLAISPTTNYDYVHGYFGVAYNQYAGGPLAPGATYTNSSWFYVPAYLNPGTWHVVVVVDGPYLAGDAESNPGVIGRDQASTPMEVVPAPPVDLAVTRVVAPTTAYSGQSMRVEWTVANNGLNRASGSWSDAVYFIHERDS